MPVILAQPEPVSPAYGQGSAADVMTKDLPVLAHLLSMYGGGHGGGGGYGGGGGDSFIGNPGGGGGGSPRIIDDSQGGGYGGGRLSESGDQPDYVGAHLAERERFQAQQQQAQLEAQARMYQQLNGQPQQAEQAPVVAPEWGALDQKALDEAKQTQAEIEKNYSDGSAGSDAPQQWKAAQVKIASLQAKQQAAMQRQQQQSLQQQAQVAAHQDSLTVLRTKHINDAMNGIFPPPSEIPGMIRDLFMVDQHGVWHNVAEKKQLAIMNHYYSMLQQQAAKADPGKQIAEADAQYHKDYAAAVKNLSKKPDGSSRHPGHDEIEAERQKIEASREAMLEQRGLRKPGQPKPLTPEQKKATQVEGFNQLLNGLMSARPGPKVPRAPEPSIPDSAVPGALTPPP